MSGGEVGRQGTRHTQILPSSLPYYTSLEPLYIYTKINIPYFNEMIKAFFQALSHSGIASVYGTEPPGFDSQWSLSPRFVITPPPLSYNGLSISVFHTVDPGSIPGNGICLFLCVQLSGRAQDCKSRGPWFNPVNALIFFLHFFFPYFQYIVHVPVLYKIYFISPQFLFQSILYHL